MVVCKNCGGTKIQVVAWIDANTRKYINEYLDGDETWCEDCLDRTQIIDKKDFKNENYIDTAGLPKSMGFPNGMQGVTLDPSTGEYKL